MIDASIKRLRELHMAGVALAWTNPEGLMRPVVSFGEFEDEPVAFFGDGTCASLWNSEAIDFVRYTPALA